jgi:SAM-dependent methyltransferase
VPPPDLTTPDGRAELDAAIEVVRALHESDPVRLASKLRATMAADLAMAAMSQARLRQDAEAKFGPSAHGMYFTRAGLEQASRAEVAAHRAARFAAAGLSEVLDLCCGIGADARAFSLAGLRVTGVEQDPETAAVFVANTGAPVVIADAKDSDWAGAESVFLDPSRRNSERRIFDPAGYSPSFDFVIDVLREKAFAAAKLAPGISHDLIPDGIEAEWVSHHGGVKEAVLWSIGFGTAGFGTAGFGTAGFGTATRRATVLGAGELTDKSPSQQAIGEIGSYLYEPDGAVIRAGLVQQAAALFVGGRRIDEHLAYLSADEPRDTRMAQGFRVLGVLNYSVARLRAELRRREVGIVEIKKRGVDVDPAALRKELKPAGKNALTVLLARVGDKRLAILAERL